METPHSQPSTGNQSGGSSAGPSKLRPTALVFRPRSTSPISTATGRRNAIVSMPETDKVQLTIDPSTGADTSQKPTAEPTPKSATSTQQTNDAELPLLEDDCWEAFEQQVGLPDAELSLDPNVDPFGNAWEQAKQVSPRTLRTFIASLPVRPQSPIIALPMFGFQYDFEYDSEYPFQPSDDAPYFEQRPQPEPEPYQRPPHPSTYLTPVQLQVIRNCIGRVNPGLATNGGVKEDWITPAVLQHLIFNFSDGDEQLALQTEAEEYRARGIHIAVSDFRTREYTPEPIVNPTHRIHEAHYTAEQITANMLTQQGVISPTRAEHNNFDERIKKHSRPDRCISCWPCRRQKRKCDKEIRPDGICSECRKHEKDLRHPFNAQVACQTGFTQEFEDWRDRKGLKDIKESWVAERAQRQKEKDEGKRRYVGRAYKKGETETPQQQQPSKAETSSSVAEDTLVVDWDAVEGDYWKPPTNPPPP